MSSIWGVDLEPIFVYVWRVSAPEPKSEAIRAHAYLSQLGVGSRRAVEDLISRGKITINGKPAKLGQKVLPGKDEIRVRGKRLFDQAPKLKVYRVHKPRGVITTKKDPQGRSTVLDLLPKKLSRNLFPVGRLDLQSEGLILLTNDGALAQRMTHPSFEVPKIYEVKIRGKLDQKKIDFLKRGVVVGTEKYKPAEVLDIREVTKEGLAKHIVKIRVFEGKNHHVRKMFEAIRCRVIRLKRIAMGSVNLKSLPLGEFRVLSDSQVRRLRVDLGIEEAPVRKKKTK